MGRTKEAQSPEVSVQMALASRTGRSSSLSGEGLGGVDTNWNFQSLHHCGPGKGRKVRVSWGERSNMVGGEERWFGVQMMQASIRLCMCDLEQVPSPL